MGVQFSRFLPVLEVISAGLEGMPEPWAITGSLGFALQGVQVEVHDMDLQTSQAGALEIERRLAAYSKRAVVFSEAERIRSYFGSLEVQGVTVEIMGDLQKRMPDGSWEAPVDVSELRLWVETSGLRLPVMDLEYEYQAYRILGRFERAALLREWLDAHPRSPGDQAPGSSF